jgi:hypothetical protein
MPFIHILICIHLFLFSFRSIQLCWTFITRSLHGIFFFVQTTAECTRTHTPTQIYTRAIQWEEQEKGKIKKKWDDRCCAITFFFLFFSFLSFRVGWTICFCLEFFFLCLLYISSNDELLSQTHWTGMLSCIYIYIRKKGKKELFLSSIQFNFHKCRQVSIFFVLPVAWLVVKYSFFFLFFFSLFFFFQLG